MEIKTMNASKYFGVHIPRDESNESDNTDTLRVYSTYEEAHKVMKEFPTARFKCFNTYAEAAFFALNGSSSGPGPTIAEKESYPFKSLKRLDYYKFRRCIETKSFEDVQKLVEENPRYLISLGAGDTPALMQEGPRYNALHIAAMYNCPQIAEFILKKVSSKSFYQRINGPGGDSSYLTRPEVMTDRYLNTPDKGRNETPLHFAAKFGSLEVVKVFIQYPQLRLDVKNKFGHTPKDVTCNSFHAKESSSSTSAEEKAWYTEQIHKLLDETFYVPVWRSTDDVVQPVIGKPYSPKSPPVCPMATSPVSPTMEIAALAGPMSLDEANNFHKTWKSPKNSRNYVSPKNSSSFGTPHLTKGILLRNPFHGEKGLEKVGRTLAKEFHVSWKEYWPFLNDFLDLASEEGLKKLEEYLHAIIVSSTNEARNSSFAISSPVSDLCNAFSKFTINSPKVPSKCKDVKTDANTHLPSVSVDYICSVFGKNVMNILKENFNCAKPAKENVVVFFKKIVSLSNSINAYRNDPAFRDVPFDKIHARAAYYLKTNIGQIDDQWVRYLTSVFQLIQSYERSELMSCISMSPTEIKIDLDSIVDTMKCVNDNVIRLLETEVISENGSESNKKWSSMDSCSCFSNNKGNNVCSGSVNTPSEGIVKARRDFRRSLVFDEDDNDVKETCDGENIQEVSHEDKCDSFVKYRSDFAICTDNSSDEEYCTAPSSSSDSESEVESADDEGPDIFIYGNKGTSMDNAVLEAIADVQIDPTRYPSIYRWKHSILLHHHVHRFNWPSPKVKR